jgi:hypothetical protein
MYIRHAFKFAGFFTTGKRKVKNEKGRGASKLQRGEAS